MSETIWRASFICDISVLAPVSVWCGVCVCGYGPAVPVWTADEGAELLTRPWGGGPEASAESQSHPFKRTKQTLTHITLRLINTFSLYTCHVQVMYINAVTAGIKQILIIQFLQNAYLWGFWTISQTIIYRLKMLKLQLQLKKLYIVQKLPNSQFSYNLNKIWLINTLLFICHGS